MELYTTNLGFASDLIDVAKLFIINTEIKNTDNLSADIVHKSNISNFILTNQCFYKQFSFSNTIAIDKKWNLLEQKRYAKRYAKLSVYFCLKQAYDKSLPWGSLTGIRPSKLAQEIIDREEGDFAKLFGNLFDVSQPKIQLISDILANQNGLKQLDDNVVDFYVNIPFCTSRCSYCSFTSGVISSLRQFVEPYVDKLCTEIAIFIEMCKQKGKKIKNIYFGGGTPTSLSCAELEKIIKLFKPNGEFTVEAGRPDTIDNDKLAMLANYGVNRISINPQTFNQSTLDLVGRRHSVLDIYQKYNLASKYNFIINMDLIAGLPQENLIMFENSIKQTLNLSPHNITVHSLALKKGSELKNNAQVSDQKVVADMVDYSQSQLYKANYSPYYMYRQKYVSESLENVGFCKNNTQCLYNIDIMEETTSIVACGCNAISKRVFVGQNRIERQANAKDIVTYLNDFDRFISQKQKLFD
ncbi:MAG: coproporphyrinogen dehydrogenase HemZ [Clostridia bacterium]